MSRPWTVLKFGGTSVDSAERWATIAGRIRELLPRHRVWVVVSALDGATEHLESLVRTSLTGKASRDLARLVQEHNRLASECGLSAEAAAVLDPVWANLKRWGEGIRLTGEAPPRLEARVLASGEMASSRLGAKILEQQGLSPVWVDSTRLLVSEPREVETEELRFLRARVRTGPDPDRAEKEAPGAEVVICPGFIARTPEGETCLLGRGGSDTSASLLAVLLEAAFLEIWTDVPGMFTADPSEIPTAHLIRRIGYREAQELAAMGARVLHPRCLDPAAMAGLPVYIRSTREPSVEGTCIEARDEEHPAVTAVTCRRGMTLVTLSTMAMWETPGFLARVFASFQDLGVSVDLVGTSQSAVTLTLDKVPGGVDGGPMTRLVERLGRLGEVRVHHPCAVVSIVGRRIRAVLRDIGSAMEVFQERPVHLISDSAEDLNLSFVVDEPDAGPLVSRLHDRLFAARGGDPRLGPTWNALHPSAPRKHEERTWWREKRENLVEIGSGSAHYVYHLPRVAANARRLLEELPSVKEFFYSVKANPHPRILETVAQEGFGLECVSAAEVRHVRSVTGPETRVLFTPNFCPVNEYAEALEAGAEVVIDGAHLLNQAPDLFSGTRVGLRVDPGFGLGHDHKVRTGGANAKFGQPIDQIEEVLAAADSRSVTLVGIHAHVGSGILNPGAWADTGEVLLSLLGRVPGAEWLDLGGGLGVPEQPGQAPLDLGALDRLLAGVGKEAGVRLRMEPGRYLVSDAGVLVAPVTQVRSKLGVHFAGMATGMNSLIRPALYGAWHTIHNLSRWNESAQRYWQIVGPICETADVLGRDRWLPDPRPGDVLLVENAGAYGAVMGSRYNLREPASERILE